jgi:hypothetical protein
MNSRLLFAFGMAGAILAGCGAGSPPGPPGAVSVANASWMTHTSKKEDLLYISDVGKNAVYVYSYPQGSPVGTLQGFNGPVRVCSDTSGNVYVTNTNSEQILEYAHGGQSPEATYKDDAYLPVDCSVDPTTGTLAVANYGTSGSNRGSVAVYKDGKGPAKILQDPGIQAYLFCTYDGSGNLFVDALNYMYDFRMLELPKGASKFETITLKQNFPGWGGVQWDGKYLAVSDGISTIYDFEIKGKIGTRKRTVQLRRAVNVVQFWIGGTTLIGPDGPNGANHDAGVWSYPHAGKPTKTIGSGDLENPSGATVSVAP